MQLKHFGIILERNRNFIADRLSEVSSLFTKKQSTHSSVHSNHYKFTISQLWDFATKNHYENILFNLSTFLCLV